MQPGAALKCVQRILDGSLCTVIEGSVTRIRTAWPNNAAALAGQALLTARMAAEFTGFPGVELKATHRNPTTHIVGAHWSWASWLSNVLTCEDQRGGLTERFRACMQPRTVSNPITGVSEDWPALWPLELRAEPILGREVTFRVWLWADAIGHGHRCAVIRGAIPESAVCRDGVSRPQLVAGVPCGEKELGVYWKTYCGGDGGCSVFPATDVFWLARHAHPRLLEVPPAAHQARVAAAGLEYPRQAPPAP